jgi:hypothetical protein
LLSGLQTDAKKPLGLMTLVHKQDLKLLDQSERIKLHRMTESILNVILQAAKDLN